VVFDVVFATLITSLALNTFTHKGFQGVSTLVRFISGSSLNDLSGEAKIGTGLVGGIPSAAVFGLSALDFRELVVDTVSYLRKHPKDTYSFAANLLVNIFASTGMYNLGVGTLGEKNLFHIPVSDEILYGVGIGSAVSGFVTNIGPTLKTFRETPDSQHPKVAELIEFFHNPNIRPLKPSTAESLRELSLFKAPTNTGRGLAPTDNQQSLKNLAKFPNA
jgi:hypothetical protein